MQTPSGASCSLDFLLFDTREKSVLLCRCAEPRRPPAAAWPGEEPSSSLSSCCPPSTSSSSFSSPPPAPPPPTLSVTPLQLKLGSLPSQPDLEPQGGDNSSSRSCSSSSLLGATIQAPRQLLLCPRRRIFVSLEVGAQAKYSLLFWNLSSHKVKAAPTGSSNDGDDDDKYDEADREEALPATLIPMPGDLAKALFGAKAAAWLDAETPERLLQACTGLSGMNSPAILAVAVKNDVVILAVSPEGEAGQVVTCHRQQIGFAGSCLAWSSDGSQLLVGGSGQLACLVWDPREGLIVRQLLAAGNVADVRAAFNGAFLCRLEVTGGHSTATFGSTPLLLPGGRRAPAEVSEGLRRQLVVEVENPQDDDGGGRQPAMLGGGGGVGGLLDLGLGGGGPSILAPGGAFSLTDNASTASAAAEAAANLQVVPNQRYLLPLRCQPVPQVGSQATSANSSRWRLSCGPEVQVDGELLDVITTAKGTAVVASASFDGSSAKAWELAPPHRWTTLQKRSWVSLPDMHLGGSPGGDGGGSSPSDLRFHGLRLLPGSSEASFRCHAVMALPQHSIFDRSAPKDLWHRFAQLELPRQDPQQSSSRRSAALAALAGGTCQTGVLHTTAAPEPQQDRSVMARSEGDGGGGGGEMEARTEKNAAALGRIASDVAGLREEMRYLREGFDDFRTDFRRMASALEAIAAHMTSAKPA